jgi:arylsulfatase A-like enzyme
VWRQVVSFKIPDTAYHNPDLSFDGGTTAAVPGYSTDLYSRFAADFIRREHDRPWFLWLCYNAPHGPTLPHDRHQGRYPGAPQGRYHRTICAVDEGVAEIRKALEETGQLDDTLLAFTSDNGFAWGEHGVSGKLAPYDTHMRVPLLVRYPPLVKAGSVCRSPVSVLDLPPTVMALAGVAQPWPMHGHDLQPLLRDPQAPWDHPVVLENFYLYFGPETDGGRTTGPTFPGIPWWISLADARYHYVRVLEPDVPEELYERAADPLEQRNLALEPQQAAVLAEYRRRLVAELKRMNAALADRLPPPRIGHGAA